MINVVYLVLIINWQGGIITTSLPQANMQQCDVNRKNYKDDRNIMKSYCIAGVMPK
jgi:hypothetical protein